MSNKNKNGNTAISFIAVILVLAIVGAAIALTKNIVDLFPDSEKDSEKVTTALESDSVESESVTTHVHSYSFVKFDESAGLMLYKCSCGDEDMRNCYDDDGDSRCDVCSYPLD